MNRMWRLAWVVLVPVSLALLAPLTVLAAGLSVGPPQIECPEAVRGEEYEQTIYVKHINDGDCVIKLGIEGDVSEWVSFYALDDSTNAIDSTTTPAGEWTYVVVRVTIPDDAPLGTAAGTIRVQAMAPSDDSEGAAVGLSATVGVSATVVAAAGGLGGTSGSNLQYLVFGIIGGVLVLMALLVWIVATRNRRRRHRRRPRRPASARV